MSVELAYAARLFDGEGHVMFHPRDKNGRKIKWHIQRALQLSKRLITDFKRPQLKLIEGVR